MKKYQRLGLILKNAKKALRLRRNDEQRKSSTQRARLNFVNQRVLCKAEIDNIEKAYTHRRKCLQNYLSLQVKHF